jgi:phosphate:Na+ symporter
MRLTEKELRLAATIFVAFFVAMFFLSAQTGAAQSQKAAQAAPAATAGNNISNSPELEKISLVKGSREGIFAIVDQKAAVSVRALRGKTPVPDVDVEFRIVLDPSGGKGTKLVPGTAITDASGLASTKITLGPKPGAYIIEAVAHGYDAEPLTIDIQCKQSNWVFLLIAGMIGSIGLFLFGMTIMEHGLQDWAGDQMKTILAALTKHRVYGLLVGVVVTAVVHSGATTVMLVGFTNAGLMSLRQAIGVILGADIGTTITAQIVAFNLYDYALLMIGVGFVLTLAGSRKEGFSHLGKVVLGFGLFFLGLKLLSEVMLPLREYPAFVRAMATTENPFIGILISAAFTSLINSSGATTGLLVTLAGQGLITLNNAIPLILGANIGSCVTAALATIGTTSREAKRVAIAHYSFKIIGVVLMLFFIHPFANFVEHFSIWTTSANKDTVHSVLYLPRQVANAHSFFNIFMALLFLPFTRQFEKIIYRIYPEDKTTPTKKFGPKYLDPFLLDIPELALRQSKREVLRMGKYVQRMIDDIINAFRERNTSFVDQAIANDEKIDTLEAAIKSYFTQLAQKKSSSVQSKRRIEMFFIVDELEKIGDVISKNILPHVTQIIENKLYFSEDGWKELNSFHSLVSENFGRVMEAFRTNDLKTAEEVVRDKQRLLRYYKQLQMGHLERLCKLVDETSRTSQVHLDILGNLRGINSHITNVATNMIEHARETGDLEFAADHEEIEDEVVRASIPEPPAEPDDFD